jgi:hypothetical protein
MWTGSILPGTVPAPIVCGIDIRSGVSDATSLDTSEASHIMPQIPYFFGDRDWLPILLLKETPLRGSGGVKM